MVGRSYEQRVRAEAAAETRRRILETVYERLREAPSQPVSLDDVARRARVARSTIYVVFGSRAGLFDALGADLMERAGYARLIESIQDEDARQVLRGGLRAGVELYATHRDVQRALYSMAALNDDVSGSPMRQIEQDRGRGMALLAEGLHEQGVLRPDVSVGEASDVLWMLASFDSFDLLYTGRQLPTDKIADILIATAERSLYR